MSEKPQPGDKVRVVFEGTYIGFSDQTGEHAVDVGKRTFVSALGWASTVEVLAAEADRPLWSGSGSDEPPAPVSKVVDRNGDVLVRAGGRWRGTGGHGAVYHRGTALPWPYGDPSAVGPWTEVRGD